MTQSAEHVMSLALDAATIKQLDDLRRAHPNVPNRKQIIERLIWDAHKANVGQSGNQSAAAAA
jgi:hypothetical protein